MLGENHTTETSEIALCISFYLRYLNYTPRRFLQKKCIDFRKRSAWNQRDSYRRNVFRLFRFLLHKVTTDIVGFPFVFLFGFPKKFTVITYSTRWTEKNCEITVPFPRTYYAITQ